MENYYNKQRDGTLAQIKNLYEEKDVTFRGFRHGDGSGGKGDNVPKHLMESADLKRKKQDIFQGNEVMDGMVNWEGSSSDGDRFNATNNEKNSKRRGLKCFEEYLAKKEKRQKEKNLEKIRKAQIKSENLVNATTTSTPSTLN